MNFIGQNIVVGPSAAGFNPTANDIPAIKDAVLAAGYDLSNVFVQLGNQYVRLGQ